MFLLCALIVGSIQGWADTVEWDLSKKTYTKGTDYVTWSSDYVTMTNSSASGGTSATNYLGGDSNNRTSSRFYANNTLTITPASGYSISSIVFTATSDNYATALKNSTWTNATAAASSSTVTVTPTNGKNVCSAKIGGTCGFTQVTVTYTTSKPNAGVSASDIDGMISGTSKADFYTITANDYDGTLNFTSDDEAIAKVEGGVLKAIAPGTAEITITAAETEHYDAVNVSFNVTVKNRDAVVPAGTGVGGYSLVTDASTLQAGDQILMVSGKVDGTAQAMSVTQNTNNRGVADVTIESEAISEIENTVQVITLEGSTDKWYFNVGNGYLYAASSGSNYLKTEEEKDDNAKAKISISEGAATITFQGTNTRNLLKYNSSSSIFSCYGSGQQNVYIYRLESASSFDVTIGSSGWRTLVSAKNVSLPSGVKAYIVTASSSSSVTLTEVASVKANNPYLLNGPAGDCTLTVIDTPVEPTGNLLQITDANTSNNVYVLSKKGEEIGFRKWTGGNLGAGRVYLPAPAANAREFISFSDSETTGIDAMHNSQCIMHNEVFDLQGRRVAQPTKGLYIVNGKKVVIK